MDIFTFISQMLVKSGTVLLKDIRFVWKRLHVSFRLFGWVLFAVVAYIFISSNLAPKDFSQTPFVVTSGSSIEMVANDLQQESYIKSAWLLRLYVFMWPTNVRIHAGSYYFSESQSLPIIFWRLITGDTKERPVAVVIPEGLNSREIANVIIKAGLEIDANKFIVRAQEYEGYLFPDTYYIYRYENVDDIIKAMSDNFTRKTQALEKFATLSTEEQQKIVIMASILEDEAKTLEDKKIVAGILNNRLESGIPLQVDAPFKYILNKNSYTLTTADLQFDSPYNTYKYKGLPPTPICNPGLDSILAALEPETTSYFYFLSEKNGTMHYAKTYAQHLALKEKYIY